jgi:hypothetical protein
MAKAAGSESEALQQEQSSTEPNTRPGCNVSPTTLMCDLRETATYSEVDPSEIHDRQVAPVVDLWVKVDVAGPDSQDKLGGLFERHRWLKTGADQDFGESDVRVHG